MKSLFKCAMFVVGVAVAGCDGNAVKDPPVALTFRQGVLSRSVMQVSNLSTAEGLEVYVYVANDKKSIRSGNIVVPANSAREFGALELDWDFNPGDRGFVRPVKYDKKLFFELQENGCFRRWFGYDDIPEVDVAAQVHARQAAEHAAWLKGATEKLSRQGAELFAVITQVDADRHAAGLASVWPRPQGSLRERAKDSIVGWKNRFTEKVMKKTDSTPAERDERTMKFGRSDEYFKFLQSVTNAAYLVESGGWSVLADRSGDLRECVPVLVSGNFPCEKLRSFWDGKDAATETIQLLPVGATRDESCVVVYKDGRVRSFVAGETTLCAIYHDAFNTCTNGYNRLLRYITPRGVVDAFGVVK